MKKLLMHICCAPCFIMPFYRLRESYAVTGFWFNENIHPVREYQNRHQCVKEFALQENIKLIDKNKYGLMDFIKKTIFNQENRCYICYYDRLNMTAQCAKERGFDCFSTSLLYSKRQNHEMLKEIGFTVAKEHSVEFMYQDFREYWKKGIELSKEKGLYRQTYCGCIFSEMERYQEKSIV